MLQLAKPIFPKGKGAELNVFSAYRTHTDSLKNTILHLTAADFYQVWVNGNFVAFGPARTAKGYARIDEINLDSYDDPAGNEIVIAVVSYNCCSLSTVHTRGFFVAEITRQNEVIAYTGHDFECFLPSCKVQKTNRYSSQRHFCEMWDLKSGKGLTDEAERAELEVLELDVTWIERRAPYPYYEDILCNGASCTGTLRFDPMRPYREKFLSFVPTAEWGRFEQDELPENPFLWIHRRRQTVTATNVSLPLTLKKDEYAIFDLSRIETGFIRFAATALENADVVIGFSEDCSPTYFERTDMNACNAMEYLLSAGKHDCMTFEPYVMRYLMVAVKEGAVRIETLGVKTFMHEITSTNIPTLADTTLQTVYEAAVRTFAHNAVDIFMDCPSRERAGWLCDSYFTAKTEYALFGNSKVEDAFLENFILYRNEGEYPEGVLPMCYPSEPHANGKFIPQWTMWYILEVEDYLNRRSPSLDREAFRPTIEGLLRFYERHENEDGLLERLPSWNFVEWSRANDWTQDVSYPTNFLYAQVLECVYRIYGDETYLEKSHRVKRTAVEQSFNGKVFLDHAIRNEDGVLVRQDDCSEAGQYYAILFGGIDLSDERYAELRRLALTVFGAKRTEEHPEIAEINAFIGAYLRLEVLLKLEEYDLVLQNVKDFFGGMGNGTGTLWEYRERRHGSQDHGFASYALVAIQKALQATDQL